MGMITLWMALVVVGGMRILIDFGSFRCCWWWWLLFLIPRLFGLMPTSEERNIYGYDFYWRALIAAEVPIMFRAFFPVQCIREHSRVF